ncbi:MAG: major capsid protein [Synergistaceae bacterium]|nr:major capsid protein [Synergistaceae bacterium]MBQ3693775.1 major capsid protein [Synergistaceae bacterium]MBQ9628365.1 major capsid protein [Synergistaceae bacterium]MBR0251691.1 major capsid protein [Synergistaceae bacterium]
MNYYEPKFLRGVIEKANPPRMFFRSRFFSDSLTYPTESVSFEYAKDNRRLLPYTSSHAGSVPLEREGYQLRTYQPPLLSGSRVITNDTLNMKLLGESEWDSGYDPAMRAQELAIRDLDELQTALFRREEYMCARLKQDGKINISGNGINGEIDYGFTNISDESANTWTETYDIFSKLQEKAYILMQAGITPDMLILGYKAAIALSKNKGFQKLRHDNGVVLDPSLNQSDGGNYVCTLLLPGLFLNVYQYLDMYYDEEAGMNKPLIDEGTAILQSSQERNMMLYGAVTYIKDNEYAVSMGRYVPYVVTSQDPPVRKLILSSRPLPMPMDNESWYVLKNAAV